MKPPTRGVARRASTAHATALALLLSAIGCGGSSPPRQAVADDSAPPPAMASRAAPNATPEPVEPAAGDPVQIEMKNVRLHMDDGIVMFVSALRGQMVSTVPGRPPVFDDPRSYVLEIFTADMAMDMNSLTNLMNRHVFNRPGSPLTDIEMEVDDGRLKQKAKLHKGIVLPVSIVAEVSAAQDGRMRLRTQKISTLGVPTKGLLHLFNLELADLVQLKQRGIAIVDDDVIIEPGRLLPPPAMQGRLTRVEIRGERLHQIFGGAGQHISRLSPPDPASRNFIYFSGSQLRFGKLTMTGADLQLIDDDPSDPFDFFPARYSQQLVAGYSTTTPQGGLKTYMPDFDDLGARRTRSK